jgi:hypothetical protein
MRRLLAVAALLASTLTARAAEAAWRGVRGHLESAAVACDSLCTHGDLTGDLEGTFDFTLETLVPTHVPDVSTYTGHSVIRTAHGEIHGRNAGVWNLATGQVVDRLTIESGTGDFEGAVGSILILGVFDAVTGMGSSDYVGAIDADAS